MSSGNNEPARAPLDETWSERPAAMPDVASWIGRRIAERYVVEGLLGEGGVGRVLRARREADGVQVAIKVLHDRLRHEPLVQKRLRRELSASQAIEHPGVVQVLEHGVDTDGRPYVCMELIEGANMRVVMEREPLTPRRIAHWLCELLSVLAEAHRRGVIHRDLKPDNVLIRRDERGQEAIKVCDFGVAKLLTPEPGTALTLEGMVCGTAEYMAPEQGSGQELDGRADVYAVGAILYELLAGVVPFEGATPIATIVRHLHEPVTPPSQRSGAPALPRELEAVCLRALAKEPSERFQSPREMSQALRAAIEMLHGRADEPLGSSAFAESVGKLVPTAAPDRMTMPGEQLRSRTKLWLGAGLLALVCAGLWIAPRARERAASSARSPKAAEMDSLALPRTPDGSKAEALPAGERALAEGKRRLKQNDLAGAIDELTRARAELGDRTDVLRALGEAQLRYGAVAEGRALLDRYLRLEPEARDKSLVEALLREAQGPR